MEHKQAFYSSRETPNLSVLTEIYVSLLGVNQTPVLLLALKNQYSRGKCWLERKVALTRKADKRGEGGLMSPKPPPKILLGHERF